MYVLPELLALQMVTLRVPLKLPGLIEASVFTQV